MAGRNMSIRTKIFLGCVSLTLITILVGLLARAAQSELGATAFRIYDEAFMSMSYLRSAQNTLLGVSRDLYAGTATMDEVADRLGTALEDLEVAQSRAMSPRGAQAAGQLWQDVSVLVDEVRGSARLPKPERLTGVGQAFDAAVEGFAGDGYRARRSVTALVHKMSIAASIAMALSVAAALAITAALSRAIVPSLRHAVSVAASIAAGRLDNKIPPGGRSETGVLLRALGTMQDSIAQNLLRIEALMAAQASNHASEIAVQHARFEAALDNMTQGLSMVGPDSKLLVTNRRFIEMFGAPGFGATIRDALPAALFEDAALAAPGANPERGPTAFTRELADGRMIFVSEQPMEGGNWLATYEDVTERHRVEARLAHMARHDSLTGLPNRILFREHMDHALAQARRGHGLAVLCLDLDHFKSVNDTLGHPIGDALLRVAAQRLMLATRETDMVVRLGGDEFAVIQYSARQPTDAKALAERLVAEMAVPFRIADHHVAIGVSIGIAVTATGLETADSLLKAADLALYRAKADGRGTFRFFETEMDARMQARRMLEVDLRRAVLEEQFEVHYQPLIDAGTRQIDGFEALVRWSHPERGMVSPGEFIPVAEEIGLISTIGLWVLNRACADAARWPAHIKIAVNLSPLQFRNNGLARDVAGVIAASGLPAARLELEITESLLLQDTEATLATLHDLRALGARISLDDFGTGYSSLSYLRRFPFDKIKIDQSFIRGLEQREDCVAIVRAIVGLGNSLGISVIAEGVETEEQLATLRREGCLQVQGYLFSRPRPLSAVKGMLEATPEVVFS